MLSDMPPALAKVLRRALDEHDAALREEILRAAACDMSIRVAAETFSIALNEDYGRMYNEILRLQGLSGPVNAEAVAALTNAGWEFDD